MNESVPPKGTPSLKSVCKLLVEGLATRAQIFGLELSVAKNNTAKIAVNAILAALFGIFALVFISVALLVIFWDEHRIFVSCCLAGFYVVLFLFFIGRARGLAANLPYAFTETKQIIATDLETLQSSLETPTSASKAHPQEGDENASR